MVDPELESLHQILARTGSAITEITLTDARAIVQGWREVYAAAQYRRTGKWKIPGYDWHNFSSKSTPSKTAGRATGLFMDERPPKFYVRLEDANGIGDGMLFLCVGGSHLPLADCESYGLDVHVFPPDLSWTAAFTHETYYMGGCGPFFSRREWQERFTDAEY